MKNELPSLELLKQLIPADILPAAILIAQLDQTQLTIYN